MKFGRKKTHRQLHFDPPIRIAFLETFFCKFFWNFLKIIPIVNFSDNKVSTRGKNRESASKSSFWIRAFHARLLWCRTFTRLARVVRRCLRRFFNHLLQKKARYCYFLEISVVICDNARSNRNESDDDSCDSDKSCHNYFFLLKLRKWCVLLCALMMYLQVFIRKSKRCAYRFKHSTKVGRCRKNTSDTYTRFIGVKIWQKKNNFAVKILKINLILK